MPIVEVIDHETKKFIVLWCPGGDNRPYSAPKTLVKNNKERIHYIRKASSTVEPSDDEEKDLFNLANRVPFDDRINHQAEISDLNITLVQNYLKEVFPYTQIDVVQFPGGLGGNDIIENTFKGPIHQQLSSLSSCI